MRKKLLNNIVSGSFVAIGSPDAAMPFSRSVSCFVRLLQLLVSRLDCSHAAPHLRMKICTEGEPRDHTCQRVAVLVLIQTPRQCSSWRPTVNNNGCAWTRQGGSRSEYCSGQAASDWSAAITTACDGHIFLTDLDDKTADCLSFKLHGYECQI